MKLLNKLLPITTIGAVACVVTPLVTSCGTGTTKVDLEDIFEKGYERKTDYKAAGDLEKTKATETYLTDLKSNTRILVDDIFQNIFGTGKNAGWPKEVKGSIGIKVSDVDTKESRLSLAFDLNLTADNYKVVSTKYEDIVLDGKISATVSINHVKVAVDYHEDALEDCPWYIHSGYEDETDYTKWFKNFMMDDQWSIKANGSINGTFAGIDCDANFNVSLNNKSELEISSEIGYLIGMQPGLYYLKDQKAK